MATQREEDVFVALPRLRAICASKFLGADY